MKVEKVSREDLEDVLALQYLCYRSEAELYEDYNIPPLTQTLAELETELAKGVCFVIKQNSVIASVRAILENGKCHIGKLIVHPDFQGQGLAKILMASIEEEFKSADVFEVFTGHKSAKNLALYRRLGYKISRERQLNNRVTLVFLEKCVRA